MGDAVWEHRFVNWLRWCRASGTHQARAGSAEGEWFGPQGAGCPTGWGDYNEAHLPARCEPVDVNDALKVNRAFISLGGQIRRAIKLLYFSGLRDAWIARKLGCRIVDLPLKAIWGKTVLRNCLTFYESKHRVSTHLSYLQFGYAGNGQSALRGAFASLKETITA